MAANRSVGTSEAAAARGPLAGETVAAYLDNAVVSGLVRRQLGDEQHPAERLLDVHDAGDIQLYTSRVTKEEIARASVEATRDAAEEMRPRVMGLPEVAELSYGAPISGRRPFRGPTEDPRLAALRKVVSDYDDARHLFHATANGIPYFVTRDCGILGQHKTLQDEFGITVVLPSALGQIAQAQTS